MKVVNSIMSKLWFRSVVDMCPLSRYCVDIYPHSNYMYTVRQDFSGS